MGEAWLADPNRVAHASACRVDTRVDAEIGPRAFTKCERGTHECVRHDVQMHLTDGLRAKELVSQAFEPLLKLLP